MENLEKQKQLVIGACNKILEERIEAAQSLFKSAEEASEAETKSSMGDKYETGRERARQLMEQASEHLEESQKMQKLMRRLEAESTSDEIKFGSFVRTSKGDFLLGIALGKVEGIQPLCFAISLVSPLGQMLSGKREGEDLTLNGNHFEVQNIC